MSDRDEDEKSEASGAKGSKSAESKSAESKSAESKSAEPKSAEAKSAESKSAQSKSPKASKGSESWVGTNIGNDPEEARSRNVAIGVLGVMTLLWILFGGASFTSDRHRPDTATFSFRGQDGYRGKQVFQAYSCMDCHTIVGNGAYFAPDLTFVYRDLGPAWLEAFLGSAGTWPTKAAVDMRINAQRQAGELNVASVDEYYTRYPHALERVTNRGGRSTIMPNLQFQANEIPALIAFFAYSSAINTQEWPPQVRATPGAVARFHAAYGRGAVTAATASTASTSTASASSDPVARGRQTAQDIGCLACHSTDGSSRVGPTWKGLSGSSVPLEGGSTVTADEAYLRTSILDSRAQIVRGFAPTMPPYEGMLNDDQVSDLVAYIQSLR